MGFTEDFGGGTAELSEDGGEVVGVGVAQQGREFADADIAGFQVDPGNGSSQGIHIAAVAALCIEAEHSGEGAFGNREVSGAPLPASFR